MSKQNKSQVGNRIILNGTALLLLAYFIFWILYGRSPSRKKALAAAPTPPVSKSCSSASSCWAAVLSLSCGIWFCC